MDQLKLKGGEVSNDLELTPLIAAIYEKYGYDFAQYANPSFKRRIHDVMTKYNLKGISELQQKILTTNDFFTTILNELTVPVTEFFRDPPFWKVLREMIIPRFSLHARIKIWCAGCATGEELYSMAILLKESNLLERSMLYGTDINVRALQRAEEGVYPISQIKEGTQNYFAAGGSESLNKYFRSDYGRVILDKSLSGKTVFSDHNLVTDSIFGEMDIILCRNVLIYFGRALQDRAIELFKDSLVGRGFLCLGRADTLSLSKSFKDFEEFHKRDRIYRKLVA